MTLNEKYANEKTVITGKNRSGLFRGIAILCLIITVFAVFEMVTGYSSRNSHIEASAKADYNSGFTATSNPNYLNNYKPGVLDVECAHNFSEYCNTVGVSYYYAKNDDFYLENYIEPFSRNTAYYTSRQKTR